MAVASKGLRSCSRNLADCADYGQLLNLDAIALGFRAIMDEGKILLLDLGRSDGETNRLIGSL